MVIQQGEDIVNTMVKNITQENETERILEDAFAAPLFSIQPSPVLNVSPVEKKKRSGGKRGASGRKKGSASWRTIIYRKRAQKEHNLRILCESFDDDEEEQEHIRKTLSLTLETYQFYFQNRKAFEEALEKKKTIEWALETERSKEFTILKKNLKRWQKHRECYSDARVCKRAKVIIEKKKLVFLKHGWVPTENIQWFIKNVFTGRRPGKKYQKLYDFVEGRIFRNGFVSAKVVRARAAQWVKKELAEYSKFKEAGKRIRKRMSLEVDGTGRRRVWRKI